LHTAHSTEAVTVGEWFHLNVAKVMVAMATDKLSFFSVCSYVCYNMSYLLVEKQSFSVLKIFAVEQLVSNIQQF